MAARRAGYDADAAAVRLGELARDGESQPGAFHSSARLRASPEEGVEDRIALFLGDTRAGIHHIDHRGGVYRARLHRKDSPGGRELHRIADEVVQDGTDL